MANISNMLYRSATWAYNQARNAAHFVSENRYLIASIALSAAIVYNMFPIDSRSAESIKIDRAWNLLAQSACKTRIPERVTELVFQHQKIYEECLNTSIDNLCSFYEKAYQDYGSGDLLLTFNALYKPLAILATPVYLAHRGRLLDLRRREQNPPVAANLPQAPLPPQPEISGLKNKIMSALNVLAEGAPWCGSRWIADAKIVLDDLTGEHKGPSTLKEQVDEWISKFRMDLVKKVVLGRQQIEGPAELNPHLLNQASFEISKYVNLPQSESSSPDQLAQHGHYAIDFFALYTKEAIVDFFDELINGIKKVEGNIRKTDPQIQRDVITAWFREHIGDEATINIFETEAPRENCIQRKAIEYFLSEMGVIHKNGDDFKEAKSD